MACSEGLGRAGVSPYIAWAVTVALMVGTVIAYSPVFDNDFVLYDDREGILAVPQIRAGLTGEGLVWAFTSLGRSNWFPITRLSWMLDAELFGMDATGFHASSLALHALNALLLLWALLRLSGAFWPSAFAAAVFALHPLHVESVAWASARKDLTSGLFFLLVLLTYERYARTERRAVWGAALVVSLVLGLMSKAMVVTLPFVLLLLDVWPLRRFRRGAAAALVREKTLLFALVVGACVVALVAQHQVMATLENFSLPRRLLSSMLAYVDYVERAVWPTDLAALYPVSRDVGSNRIVLAVFGLAIASVLCVRHVRTRPWYFVGWFWYVGMLVPVIGLVQIGAQASADRYTYLPLIGLSIVVAWGARDLVAQLPAGARRPAGLALGAAACAVCVLWIGMTREQVRTWSNDRTLFEHALAVTGDNPYAQLNLGLSLHAWGEPESALRHFEEAVRLDPENEHLRNALEGARKDAARRRAP